MTIVNDVKRKVLFKDLSVGDTFLKEDRSFLYIIKCGCVYSD